MLISKKDFSVEQFIEEIEKGLVSFDYPIQREGEQWSKAQKSLLIHSIACGYPVPPIYALSQMAMVGEGSKARERMVLFLLDGKQRITNLIQFIKGGGVQRIHEDTPPFRYTRDEDKEEVEEDFTNRSFEELPVEVQKSILRFTLDIHKIEDALDSEIESMFFRLNNGTPLTQVQKAKANMGSDTANKFKRLVKHLVVNKNAVFTPYQIKQADHEVALLQAMMLIDEDYNVSDFGNNTVYEYASALRDADHKVFAQTEATLDYIRETLGSNVERTLLKKLHFPMVVWASHEALKAEVPPALFTDWLEDFKEKIKNKENGEKLNGETNENAWLYKLGCGAGATKVNKVAKRLEGAKIEIMDFIQKLDEAEKEDREAYERLKAEKAEQARLKAEEAEQAKIKAEEEKVRKEAEKERKLAEKAQREAEKAEKARLRAEKAEQTRLTKEAKEAEKAEKARLIKEAKEEEKARKEAEKAQAQAETVEQTELIVEGENIGEVK